MLGPLLVLLGAATPAPPVEPPPSGAAAELEGSARLDARGRLRATLGAEWDSNAQRRLSSRPADVRGDSLVRLLLDGSLELGLGDRHRAQLGYVLGAKRFSVESTEDVLVHDLGLGTTHRLAERVSIRSYGSWRQSRIRNGSRDYTLGGAGGGLAWQPHPTVSLDLQGGWVRLAFPPERRLAYEGPRLGAELAWRPTRGLRFSSFVDHAWRDFDGNAVAPARVPDGQGGTRIVYSFCDGTDGIEPPSCNATARADSGLFVGVRARYQGRFVLGGELTLRTQRSNSAFEDFDRYRVVLYATVPLPGELVLNLMGAVQLISQVSLTNVSFQFMPEDDENQNSARVQLQRRLGDTLGAFARWELFANEFATADVRFFRQTVSLGLEVQLDSGR
jgi:hypothetical protein